MKGRILIAAFSLVALVFADDELCKLSEIKPWPPLKEETINGSWFEMRWYPTGDLVDYENLAQEITHEPDMPGFYVRTSFRSPPVEECRVLSESYARRISNGLYERDYEGGKALSTIFYTDSGISIMAEYICTDYDETYCYEGQARFFYRKPFARRDVKCPYPEKIKETLYRLVSPSCINADRFRRSLHRPGACAEVTNPPPPVLGPADLTTTPAAPAPRRCSLSNVKVQPNIDEQTMAGSWYEVRWYPSDYVGKYENYAYSITPESEGVRVKVMLRSPPEADCNEEEDTLRVRIRNGVYEYYSAEYQRNLRIYVTFLDDRFMMEYMCLEWDGDFCYRSEYAMFYRAPLKRRDLQCPNPQDIEKKLNELGVDQCFDVNRFERSLHRENPCVEQTHVPIPFDKNETTDMGTPKPTPRPRPRPDPRPEASPEPRPEPTPEPRQDPTSDPRPQPTPETRPYPSPLPPYPHLPGFPHYHVYDAELLALAKENEEAAKEKFEAEKEMLEAEKELIRLQIEHLRRGFGKK